MPKALRCSYRGCVWQVPLVVFLIALGIWMITSTENSLWQLGLASFAVVAGVVQLVEIGRRVFVGKRSPIGLAHWEASYEGISITTLTGVVFVDWRSVVSISEPKSLNGVGGWYRPFYIESPKRRYKIKYVPTGLSFEEARAALVSLNSQT